MIGRIVFGFTATGTAFMVLVISILQAASVKQTFAFTPQPTPETEYNNVDYPLPYPGKVSTLHPLWPLKVVRDKLWMATTTNNLERSQLSLLHANKRLMLAEELISLGEWAEGVETLGKSQVYLNESYEYLISAQDTENQDIIFAYELSLASLKHREVLETFLIHAPDGAKQAIIKYIDTPKGVYEKTSHYLQEREKNPPENPFNQ